jgi:hypothetical protein
MKEETYLIKKIDEMLEIWARWSRSVIHNETGYSRLSVLGWIIETGGIRSVTKGTVYPPDNPIAEQVDKWIKRLIEYAPTDAKTLILYYLGESADYDKSNHGKKVKCSAVKEIIARRLGVTTRVIERRIYTAKAWLCGCYCEYQGGKIKNMAHIALVA